MSADDKNLKIIAEKAGLNTTYPGISEYKDRISTNVLSPIDLKKQSAYSHSINENLIEANNLHLKKYENRSYLNDENRNLRITGNSESRTRYTNKFSELDAESRKKVFLTRNDFNKNPHLNNTLPFQGLTEYNQKFVNNGSTTDNSIYVTNVTINPKYDLNSASQGRPLTYLGDDEKKIESETVYRKVHAWPKREKRELFEWIRF